MYFRVDGNTTTSSLLTSKIKKTGHVTSISTPSIDIDNIGYNKKTITSNPCTNEDFKNYDTEIKTGYSGTVTYKLRGDKGVHNGFFTNVKNDVITLTHMGGDIIPNSITIDPMTVSYLTKTKDIDSTKLLWGLTPAANDAKDAGVPEQTVISNTASARTAYTNLGITDSTHQTVVDTATHTAYTTLIKPIYASVTVTAMIDAIGGSVNTGTTNNKVLSSYAIDKIKSLVGNPTVDASAHKDTILKATINVVAAVTAAENKSGRLSAAGKAAVLAAAIASATTTNSGVTLAINTAITVATTNTQTALTASTGAGITDSTQKTAVDTATHSAYNAAKASASPTIITVVDAVIADTTVNSHIGSVSIGSVSTDAKAKISELAGDATAPAVTAATSKVVAAVVAAGAVTSVLISPTTDKPEILKAAIAAAGTGTVQTSIWNKVTEVTFKSAGAETHAQAAAVNVNKVYVALTVSPDKTTDQLVSTALAVPEVNAMLRGATGLFGAPATHASLDTAYGLIAPKIKEIATKSATIPATPATTTAAAAYVLAALTSASAVVAQPGITVGNKASILTAAIGAAGTVNMDSLLDSAIRIDQWSELDPTPTNIEKDAIVASAIARKNDGKSYDRFYHLIEVYAKRMSTEAGFTQTNIDAFVTHMLSVFTAAGGGQNGMVATSVPATGLKMVELAGASVTENMAYLALSQSELDQVISRILATYNPGLNSITRDMHVEITKVEVARRATVAGLSASQIAAVTAAAIAAYDSGTVDIVSVMAFIDAQVVTQQQIPQTVSMNSMRSVSPPSDMIAGLGLPGGQGHIREIPLTGYNLDTFRVYKTAVYTNAKWYYDLTVVLLSQVDGTYTTVHTQPHLFDPFRAHVLALATLVTTNQEGDVTKFFVQEAGGKSIMFKLKKVANGQFQEEGTLQNWTNPITGKSTTIPVSPDLVWDISNELKWLNGHAGRIFSRYGNGGFYGPYYNDIGTRWQNKIFYNNYEPNGRVYVDYSHSMGYDTLSEFNYLAVPALLHIYQNFILGYPHVLFWNGGTWNHIWLPIPTDWQFDQTDNAQNRDVDIVRQVKFVKSGTNRWLYIYTNNCTVYRFNCITYNTEIIRSGPYTYATRGSIPVCPGLKNAFGPGLGAERILGTFAVNNDGTRVVFLQHTPGTFNYQWVHINYNSTNQTWVETLKAADNFHTAKFITRVFYDSQDRLIIHVNNGVTQLL